jgi:hypothetical protein
MYFDIKLRETLEKANHYIQWRSHVGAKGSNCPLIFFKNIFNINIIVLHD